MLCAFQIGEAKLELMHRLIVVPPLYQNLSDLAAQLCNLDMLVRNLP